MLFRVDEGGRGVDLNGDGDLEDEVVHALAGEDAEVWNTGLAGEAGLSDDPDDRRWFGVVVDEAAQGGADLNGDGDANDGVVHLLDVVEREVYSTGVAPKPEGVSGGDVHVLNGSGMVWSRSELIEWLLGGGPQADYDLNGDGDVLDHIAFVHDRLLGTTELLVETSSSSLFRIHGRRAVIPHDEDETGQDLNGDGDATDLVRVVYEFGSGRASIVPLASPAVASTEGDTPFLMRVAEKPQGETDLNGDGDVEDKVLHVVDVEAGTHVNLGVAVSFVEREGRWISIGRSEQAPGLDLNGDGDVDDHVVQFHDLQSGELQNTALAGFGKAANERIAVIEVDEVQQQGKDFDGDGVVGQAVVVLDLIAGAGDVLAWADASSVVADGPRVAYVVPEGDVVFDLNGDGLIAGDALFVLDMDDGSEFVVPIQVWEYGATAGAVLAWGLEQSAGVDVNGDGYYDDAFLRLVDSQQGESFDLRLIAPTSGTPVHSGGGVFAIAHDEADQGGDLNGDGDLDDDVLFVLRRE